MKKKLNEKIATKTDINQLRQEMATKKDLEREIGKVRQVMATKKDLQHVSEKVASLTEQNDQQHEKIEERLEIIASTVNDVYLLLDDEARFIRIMRAEFPILTKRVERIEDKLKLPHALMKSS